MTAQASEKDEEKTSKPPFVEAWEKFWKEFVWERRRHGCHIVADEPVRWFWFELNNDDREGLLRITDNETLVFGCRHDGEWYFVGVQDRD